MTKFKVGDEVRVRSSGGGGRVARVEDPPADSMPVKVRFSDARSHWCGHEYLEHLSPPAAGIAVDDMVRAPKGYARVVSVSTILVDYGDGVQYAVASDAVEKIDTGV